MHPVGNLLQRCIAHAVGRQREGEGSQALHGGRAALGNRHRRQLVPDLPDEVRNRLVRRHDALFEDHLAPGRVRHAIDLSGQQLHDVARCLAVEERQQAVDGVELVVAGHASGERRTHHATEQLLDVVVVLRGTERHQHLGSRAVPAGRDRVLRDEDPHVRPVLDHLRLDPIDLVRPERLSRVLTQHVPDGVGSELRHLLEDDVQRFADLVVIRRVGRLQHQQRLHHVGQPLRFAVLLPAVGRVLQLLGSAPHEHHVDRLRLGRDVDLDEVLDQTRLLDLEPIDLDRRQVAPVARDVRVVHRLLEVADGRGDAPHDRNRRQASVTVDQPLNDGRLVAGRLRAEPSVRLVDDQVQRQVGIIDRVRDGLPDRVALQVWLDRGVHALKHVLLGDDLVPASQQRRLRQLLRVEEVHLARPRASASRTAARW